MGLAIVALIVLVIVAVVAVPIFIRVLGEAAGRNPNRPEEPGSEEREGDQSQQSGPNRD